MLSSRGGVGVAVVGEIVYALGGVNPGTTSGELEAYDPAAVVGGLLYVVGGSISGRYLATVEAYQP
jgi:hypothetical protein